jgi:hypothetical protein
MAGPLLSAVCSVDMDASRIKTAYALAAILGAFAGSIPRRPIEDRAESVLVVAKTPAVSFSEYRNRSFTAITIGRPHTT